MEFGDTRKLGNGRTGSSDVPPILRSYRRSYITESGSMDRRYDMNPVKLCLDLAAALANVSPLLPLLLVASQLSHVCCGNIFILIANQAVVEPKWWLCC